MDFFTSTEAPSVKTIRNFRRFALRLFFSARNPFKFMKSSDSLSSGTPQVINRSISSSSIRLGRVQPQTPAFDSQTKETLTIKQTSFGSTCELTPDFLEKVAKYDIMKKVLSRVQFKEHNDLRKTKTDGNKRGKLNISKLEEANFAATNNSDDCTLILTEGDSAKTLAMSVSSGVGQDYYCVFPLKGKLLNVREASPKQLKENAEIQNIKKIFGLQLGKEYDNVKSLRYCHLMMMADQVIY
ncbi:hypothetical protein L2E82_47254 [Cichorium intybus]|uniref:Uncharacterized protein n=1 Tax=Cichorium intybus TaxID=13427 RepID=A0ACB8YUZ9_CICIN|nr:hypothetical protein L2E82_47254 [Cichorium intybus]